MMVSFQTEALNFNYRMGGLCIHKDRILLHQFENDEFWTLPGGRADILEDSRTTVKREFKEETGYDVKVGKALWIVERLFDFQNKKWHQLGFIYQVDFPEGSPCLDQDEFYGWEGEHKIIFRWFSFEAFKQLNVYPKFLKKQLPNLPETLEHIIERSPNFEPYSMAE